jgi:hypothetical protein
MFTSFRLMLAATRQYRHSSPTRSPGADRHQPTTTAPATHRAPRSAGVELARAAGGGRSAPWWPGLVPVMVELVPVGELAELVVGELVLVGGLVPVGGLAELVVVGRCRARRAGGG